MDAKLLEKPKTLILGFFDGLHQGHKSLFMAANEPFGVLTFQNIPHKANNFLYEFNERIEQLKQFNPKVIYWMDIAKHNMSGQAFCEMLANELKVEKIIVGSDYRFGNDWQDINLLKQFFKQIHVVQRTAIATSQIKNLIKSANLPEANQLLVVPYYRKGVVIRGNGDGKKIGFPTANIKVDNTLIDLPTGSYVSTVELNNQIYQGVSFIGNGKTLNRHEVFLETHIFDFDASIYGQTLKVNLLQFIRTNEKFASIDVLVDAIKSDINHAKQFFRKNTNGY